MRNVRNVAGTTGYLALLLAAAGAGCDGPTSSSPQGESGSVMSLAGALQAAVSECAAAAAQCEATGADAADARAQCRSEFESCREAAKAAAKPDIDKAVNPCAEAFKGCRADASADREQCRASLTACLGAQNGDAGSAGEGQGKPERDAEVAEESKSPVADCVSALHTCITSDDPAKDCTDALRVCIADSVGHSGNGMPADPGKPDAGKPDVAPAKPDDAGKPDNPGQSADAGKPVDVGNPDAGMPADPGSSDDSKACKEAREACLSGGGAVDACARMLKECRMK